MALVKRIGEKLFEEFLIIGPYKNEFYENDGQKLPTNSEKMYNYFIRRINN